MAKKSREEILNQIKAVLGDNAESNEAIALYEDITDSIEQEKSDSEDWEQKYKDNDEMWRKKYSARFFESTVKDPESIIKEPQQEQDEKPLSLEDLFETESEE